MQASRTPAISSGPGFRWCLTGAILAVGLMLAAPATAARYSPVPNGNPTIIQIGASAKTYYRLSATEPLMIVLVGPGELSGYARAHFAAGETETKDGRLILLGTPAVPATRGLSFKPSAKSTYTDARDGRPSGGRRFAWQLPAGEHTVELRGECAGGADILVTLYYDGPPQPASVAAAVAPTASRPAKKKSKARFTWRNSFDFDVIYDSNFLSSSDDDLDEWRAQGERHNGSHDERYNDIHLDKFRMKTSDDMVLAPNLRLEIRRKFFDFGQTRLRGKFSHWQYVNNPIKNNHQFDFYLRQYLAPGRSIELSYFYAPEQYIRELKDLEPFEPQEDPTVYKGFRFTKNVLGVTFRQKLSKRFSGKLLYERNLRYYNQAFIENDINAWEIRGTLYVKLHKRWNLSVDYSYEDAQARGIDEIDEIIVSGDNSDGSYLRDLFRLGITWKPTFLRPVVDQIDLSGLLMLYYYTATKQPFDDRFHVGRKDNVYKLTLALKRKLNKTITADLGARFTERTLNSPWPDVVAIDKAYTKYRIWLGLTYKL